MNDKQQRVDIVTHIDTYLRYAALKRVKRTGSIGLASNTLRLYQSLRTMWVDFKTSSGADSLYLDALDRDCINAFTYWLVRERKYALNYVGQLLKMTKTIAKDAVKSGYVVHTFINHIEGFTQAQSDRRIITLNEKDIDLIWQLKGLTDAEENYRRWLLLGLYVGQRVSDLLTITPKQIRAAPKGMYIDFLQRKTGKAVTVGVKNPRLVHWLRGFEFIRISSAAFNTGIKRIAKRAGINEPVEGYKKDAELKRNRLGVHPKYQLISSHCMRRSFATNHFGKVPTPLLMEITGHTKETTFLSYIGRSANKDHYADAFMEAID